MIILSIGIYKIENLLNNKVYIGQSIHIETRWKQHCQNSSSSLIGKAIKKYGKNNFSFQILKECEEKDLDSFEEKYINQYQSLAPNGYNIILTSPTRILSFNKNNYNILLEIITDIKDTELSFKEIADKYDLDLSMIYYINRGDFHTLEGLTYPLRPVKDFSKKHYYCCDCGIEIYSQSQRCIKCSHVLQQKVARPNRDELKKMIREKSFVQIGKDFGVSDKAITKWCIAYNLPSKKTDIKKISDVDWEKI